ncbi:PhoH family protein [Bifidobacterium aquikefiricola]|uniref:PhoH-like protein n=1 Tax=Bifidobacterium aquikefiricola TaxID=3059038 RepID=A0AB39U8X7_9BIFI
MATTTRTITIPTELNPVNVLGPVDEVIREVERAFPDLTIIVRGNRIAIMATTRGTERDAQQAQDVIETIIRAAYTAPMDADTVRRMLERDGLRRQGTLRFGDHEESKNDNRTHGNVSSLARDTAARAAALHEREGHRNDVPGVITFALGVPVRAKTAGQIAYVNAISTHTITFAIGPAGTGKTYLAVAKAVRAFQNKEIRKIILTRPAVEAGENLGFLPGTLNEKVDPYLRPLYDALSDMLGVDQMKHYMDDGTIEVAPLAYMRGRTLNDAFVILDEAQNTTAQQMKMFLTRLGFNTTMVITGDITQIDLTVPNSGLAGIERILKGVEDIAFIKLEASDVVRHKLVAKIVEAYEKADEASSRKRRDHAGSHDGANARGTQNHEQNHERNHEITVQGTTNER